MPRPLRLEFENAWYHVMNRGAGKRGIFKSDAHRNKFLEILGQAVNLFGIEIHAYCLMGNHYHLMIKTPRANLSRAMRHINGVYTQYFNLNNKTDGPLFRGRYKAIIIDGDNYLLQVSRYIHLNPIVTKIVKKAEEYRWSSYRDYIKPKKQTSWLNIDEILLMMSNKKSHREYQRFVEEGLDNETHDFYNRVNMPVVFGDLERKKMILKKSEKKIKDSRSDYKRIQELPSLEKVSTICAKYFNLKVADLYLARRGQSNEPRKIAMYGSRMWSSEKLSNIADLYNCKNHSSVSNIVKQVEVRMQKDKKLEKIISEIQKILMR